LIVERVPFRSFLPCPGLGWVVLHLAAFGSKADAEKLVQHFERPLEKLLFFQQEEKDVKETGALHQKVWQAC